ncbi:diaminopropionate ammonia-lyase [Thalassospira alkalitolerans]|uniref:diaminopropionate ammonia-lyase n=1 Tax=Thalassospira alkalitolerans TaxID=1293890 RepID=UPI003AA8DA68
MTTIDALKPGREDIYQAFDLISSWLEYQQSPLIPAPGLARELDLGAVWIKDESKRFGLGGVKALGAPYGLKQQLLKRGLTPGSPQCADYTAIAATDGNHGLAVAWAAQKFGCHAQIYVGSDVDQARIQRIVNNGAEIIRIKGTYDDAVVAAEAAAKSQNILLITDTDYGDTLDVTRDIMAGYAVLGIECTRQLQRTNSIPSHVFLQCGVGGMAAGCAMGLWHESGQKPNVYSVEATNAACIKASLAKNKLTSVPGKLLTRMIGLSCGRPSFPAFEILRAVCKDSIAINDDVAKQVQDRLSYGINDDQPLDTWDTGIAGIAGLWHVAKSAELRKQFNINTHSEVLVVNSEGAIPSP